MDKDIKNDLPEMKDWKEVAQFTAELIRDNNGGNLASECIQAANKQTKKWFIISMALLIGFIASNAYWIYQTNSYSYIIQDGEGLNNINDNGSQGDVNNVPNVQEEK